MLRKYLLVFQLIIFSTLLIAQEVIPERKYNAGFTSVVLKDKARIYKPKTAMTDSLHFRPVDLDIWYPSEEKSDSSLVFGDLFKLFEQRAVAYQDNEDYKGLTKELAQFYVAETIGGGADGQKLLNIKTQSFRDVKPVSNKCPVIIYMAGLNGMSFENYKVLEKLAENGFIVVSIWSVGRYPGDMTNEKEDMLEQVNDAKFALKYLQENKQFRVDLSNIGVLGYSWGGMGAMVFANDNENVKAVVSYDGSETHYFGEETTANIYANGASEKDNDRFIQEIYDSNLLTPKNQRFEYMYFESGNQLEFTPVSEYNYFKKINSKKYYLRFKNGKHVDFSCIPLILEASEKSVYIYNNIENATVDFFKKSLKKEEGFLNRWKELVSMKNTTTELFDISKVNKLETTFEIKGRVHDSKTNKVLPYVNVVLLNSQKGTVTDDKGGFRLEIDDLQKNNTISISMIGYKSKTITVKDFKKEKGNLNIVLEEDINQLNEVVVKAPKIWKTKVLGNKTKSKFIGHLFYSGCLGKEMGIKINIRKKPTYIDEFNFHIYHNRFVSKAFFRLNMYAIDKGKPTENILKQNIIIPVEAKQTGVISADLRKYGIVVSEDILVALEWVGVESKIRDTDAIAISLGVLTGGTYERENVNDKMKKKLKGMGLGFTLKVRQ